MHEAKRGVRMRDWVVSCAYGTVKCMYVHIIICIYKEQECHVVMAATSGTDSVLSDYIT